MYWLVFRRQLHHECRLCPSAGKIPSLPSSIPLCSEAVMKHAKLPVLAFLSLAVSALAFGQAAVTSLRGTVSETSGGAVAGAQVDLDDRTNGSHAIATTGTDGAYEFPQLKPGSYTITVASGGGFAKQTKFAELLVSQPATIN